MVNGFYSPLEKAITESKQDKMPAKQWLDKFAKGEEAKWTGLQEWLSQQQGAYRDWEWKIPKIGLEAMIIILKIMELLNWK